LVAFLYGSHAIRGGKNSIIYSKQGVGVMVPKRISDPVAEPIPEAAE